MRDLQQYGTWALITGASDGIGKALADQIAAAGINVVLVAILSNAKKLDPEVLTKSGIMLGLGETMHEIKAAMRDLRGWGVDILTIGQYLQPSKKHLPIARYYSLEEFKEFHAYGRELGFKWVESAPLVRSSYHAGEQVQVLSAVHRQLYGGTNHPGETLWGCVKTAE